MIYIHESIGRFIQFISIVVLIKRIIQVILNFIDFNSWGFIMIFRETSWVVSPPLLIDSSQNDEIYDQEFLLFEPFKFLKCLISTFSRVIVCFISIAI